MSSTNRGGAARQIDDFYSTPSWATRAILPHLRISTAQAVLEPACGLGAIARELRDAGVGADRLVLLDINQQRAHECAFATFREGGAYVEVRDFLSYADDRRVQNLFDLTITNPPYSLALEFIEAAFKVCAPGGEVAMLLRLNFLGGQKRAAWHRAHPADVYVLPRRPSFTEHLAWNEDRGETRCPLFLAKKGRPRCDRAAGHDLECLTIGTDSCEYAWFCWGEGHEGRVRVLEVE